MLKEQYTSNIYRNQHATNPNRTQKYITWIYSPHDAKLTQGITS